MFYSINDREELQKIEFREINSFFQVLIIKLIFSFIEVKGEWEEEEVGRGIKRRRESRREIERERFVEKNY